MILKGSQFNSGWWINDLQYGIVMSGGGEPADPGQSDPPPAVDPPASDPPADPSPSDPPEADPPSDPTPTAAKVPEWVNKRIGYYSGKNKELAEELRKRDEELAALRAGQQPTPVDSAEFARRVREEAANMAATEAFTRDVNKLVEEGKKTYAGEWDARVNSLAQLVNQNDPASVAAYQTLVAAAIETGEGAKVLHSLGGNLEEADRILGLSPVRMGVELAKLAAKPQVQVTRAPNPIRPVGGSHASSSEIDPTDPERADSLSTAEWMRRREAQEAAANAARRGR